MKKLTLVWTVLLLSYAVGCGNGNDNVNIFPSQGGNAQIHPQDDVVYMINPETDSMAAVRVRSGNSDVLEKLEEVKVGTEPRCIVISPSGNKAYVTNGADGTVTVIDMGNGEGPFSVEATIAVGSEPRGCGISPSGNTLYVANFSDGTVSVIDTSTNSVSTTIDLGDRNPYAVAVTNDLDGSDSDETVFVSDFFAKPRANLAVDQIEGFNNGKEGRVFAINAADNTLAAEISLAPVASGFNADRTTFCVANGAVNDTFCVDNNGNPSTTGGDAVPQEAFPNQISTMTVDPATGKLYIPNIGASPEPPVQFNLNVQALVNVINPADNTELAGEAVNLNNFIKTEDPNVGGLVRTFAADTRTMAIRNGVVAFVSTGGALLIKGGFDANGVITLNEPNIERCITGNIPDGVALNSNGTRAYVSAQDGTLTACDMTNLTNNANIGKVVATGLPPPGSVEHNVLLGKLVFFTGMGTPNNDLIGKNIQDIDTHAEKNKASDNNWSSCASCHPDGLADGVTWIFATGPRQTIPLDAFFSPVAGGIVQRVSNWNAVRGSITDFNNNSINVQGGEGFADDPALIFNHGPNEGVSEALDLETLWVEAGVRTPNADSTLDAAAVARGSTLFSVNAGASRTCNECHGGPSWTASQVNWDYPLFDSNPLAGGTILNADVINAGAIIQAFDDPFLGQQIDVISGGANGGGGNLVGTLDLGNPIEIRGIGGAVGQGSVGAAGSFNPPSLLGARNSAPYGHHGRALTIEEVFETRVNGGLEHDAFGYSAAELADVAEFVRSIDGTTPEQ